MVNRAPDYESKSQLIQQECENDIALKAAREEIFKELTESVRFIKDLRTHSDPSIVLKSCKEHLTLAGMYIDRVDHSGSFQFKPIKIMREGEG